MRLISFFWSVFFLTTSFSNAEIVKKNRIVSLMPSYTEIIFALDAQDQLVGVSNFCNYPAEALKKEKTGDYLRPNFEKIYSLKPDIVFAPQWKNSILLKNLKSLGLNVTQFKDESAIKDIFKTIRIIASKTNKKARGKILIKKLKERLKTISKKTALNRKKPRVYIEVDNKYWTAGKNSFLSDVIEKAGGENIFVDIKRSYFQTSWESILERNPDIIISLWGNEADYIQKPLAQKISAVSNSQIISNIERDKIARPALRVFEVIEELSLKFNENK
jgi:cobalamin transport system substrate-binding protein